jgi:rod shape-determining protein MreC
LIIAILLSIVLMGVDHRHEVLEPVRQTLSAAVHPIRLTAQVPLSLLDAASDRMRSRDELAAELERLRRQQLLYEARLQRLDALEVENIRLRELLDSSHDLAHPVLIAELIEIDLDPQRHLIQVNKGTNSNVYAGQPVLDANGVVGQVDEVGPFSARVRLITDPSHGLPVQINRNGLRAIAAGTGQQDRLRITSLTNNADVKEGDLLVTSGLGGRFPQGYPVARIATVTTRPGRPFARVEASPTAALNRIQEVLLVKNRSDGDTENGQ